MSGDPMAKRRGAGKAAILIVDDHEAMRAVLRQFVQQVFPRCAVHEAADGAQALEQSVALRPHLVLMDIRLPDANGIELTARIRSMLPDTEVIVVSCLDGPPYVERALAAGACAFVAKDRLHRELLPAMKSALGTPWSANDSRAAQAL